MTTSPWFSAYLCDGVSQRADHHAPHPPQLLLVLERPSTVFDGTKHSFRKRQRGSGA